MINIETHNENSIIAVKASKNLRKKDFDKLVPAFWEDLKLDAEFIGEFDRIAIVGEMKWQKWGTNLLDSLTNNDLKFFDIKNADGDAWLWLRDKVHS